MEQSLVKLNNVKGCSLESVLKFVSEKDLLPELRDLCSRFFLSLEPQYFTLFDLEDLQFVGAEGGPLDYFFLEVVQFHDFIGFNRVHQYIRFEPPKTNCISLRFWDVGPDTNLTHVCRTDNAGVAAVAFGIANELNVE